MVKEVYLKDNEEAIEIRDLDTDELISQYSYMHEGKRIWDLEDSWRIVRHTHLRNNLYKEVYKCKCGKVIRIPNEVIIKIDELNNISFPLTCFDCGNQIKIKCDTLVIDDGTKKWNK